jgi:hypothetical protein
MMLSRGRHCIQAAWKRFLDQHAKCNPGLGSWQQVIPFLERPDVQAGSQEKTDCIVDQPQIRVWVAAQKRNLGTIFDTPKKHFRCIGCRILATESSVIDFLHSLRGLAIDARELIKNILNSHFCMPYTDAGII